MAKFMVTGANGSKIVERARARGVPLYKAELSGRELIFRTKQSDTRTMIAILNNMCYHKSIRSRAFGRNSGGTEEKNVYRVDNDFNWKYLLSRGFLALIAAVFLFSCAYIDGRIFEIEISSDNNALVQSLLDEYGIKQGQKVQDIKDVENYLNRRLDARYVFVRKEGIKLSVEVWAPNGQPLEPADKSITAPCDGVVQSVILLSGTSKVKAGDSVKKGDVLIEGKITGADGKVLDCKASGEVFLECEILRTFEYETVRRSPYRTGKSISYTEIDFLFGSYGAKENPYSDFETEVSENPLNYFFPFVCRRVSIFELGYVTETVDFEKIKDFVLAQMTRQAVEESENEVLSSRTEVSGEETKIISVFLRTLIKCGGTFGNSNL